MEYRYQGRRVCLPDTRDLLLYQIREWRRVGLFPIYLLIGFVGTGKTVIAATVAEDCHADKVLGACYFSVGDLILQNQEDPNRIIPILAYQLARTYPEFELALSPILSTEQALHGTIQKQAENLIIKPLRRVINTEVVIIIDALDGFADTGSLPAMLEALTNIALQVQKVRLFITSRPNKEIMHHFLTRDKITTTFSLHEVPRDVVNHDI